MIRWYGERTNYMRNRKKILNILLLVFWMALIFFMSHQTAIESTNQSDAVVNFINKILGFGNIDLLIIFVRKTAHLLEYLVLGVLMVNCFKDYGFNKYLLISTLLCFLYACSDEFHQFFVVGRSAQLSDILIDSIGSIFGCLLYVKLKNKIYKI